MTADTSWTETMPEIYDRALGPVLFAPFARELAARAAAARPRRVLELAAGTGRVTAELVAVLPGADVLATDLNPAMVAWGSARVPRARWEQADAQQVPLADGSVDLVACAFGAMFFPDRVGAYAQMARVLVPGGTLLLAVWDVVAASPLVAALVAALGDVLPGDPPTFITRVPHGYTDVGVIASDVRAGGFTDVEVERVSLPGRAASAAALAEGFCQGTPLRFELAARGRLPEVTAAVAAAMTARLGEGPVEGELGALVVTARRDGT